jgi:hypothetical protein
MYAKQPAYRNAHWLRAVASLPCVVCKREGQTQAAHINQGKGMGIKTHDCLTAALCMHCHSMVDQGHTMTKAERRAFMDSAVLLTLIQLAQRGLVVPA